MFFFVHNNQHPEFVHFDIIKEESEEDNVEMESSCDSVRDNLETQTNVEDKTLSEEKLTTIKPESHGVRLSKTIPLINSTTPIIPINCNETNDQDESLSNKNRPKESIRHHHAKKPKMCTVCGKLVKWCGFLVKF